MKKFILAVSLSLLSLFSFSSYASKNIVLFYTGPAQPNGKPLPEQFKPYCDEVGGCVPSTTVEMTYATTGCHAATIYVWTSIERLNGTLNTSCFTEFVEYRFEAGTVYTKGGKNRTCGALADPALIPVPTDNTDPIVIVGGGSGDIIDATGIYKNFIGGTYIDRTYVGLVENPDGTLTVNNYSGLYFTLMPRHKDLVSDKPKA